MAFALLAVAVLPMARLAPAGVGLVSVTGHVRGKLTLSVSHESVDFGSAGNQSGPDSPVVALSSNAGIPSVCYLWKGPEGKGNTITVASNKPWTGYVRASDDTDTPALSMDSGRFRFGTSVPSDYDECAKTGFVPLQEEEYQWEGAGRRGRYSYTHYYSLTVERGDEPVSFRPRIVYTVYQY